jgi:ribosome maturation factor RimP
MEKDEQIRLLEKLVNEHLAEAPQFFLVQVRIKPTNNIKVYVDGDKGITIEDCIRLNRKLYKQLEEMAIYPDGDFSLEVSSPGVGEPLLLHRQYTRNLGRLLEVTQLDGSVHTGELKAVTEESIELEISSGKGKKATVTQQQIPINQIKEATVQIKF